MSFLQGSFSAQRFAAPWPPDADVGLMVAALDGLTFDRTLSGEDGVQAGWGGGDHELDGELSCEKNLRGEFLHFAFRVTQFKPPASRVKALYQIGLKALLAASGAGRPTRGMKAEARAAAQAAIEAEGADGRHLKHTVVPVVWDGKAGQVWYGSSAHAHTDRFAALFHRTFGVAVTPLTAGALASDKGGGDAPPEPAFTGETPAWCPDGLDWLGNEFALWVLWGCDTAADPDGLAVAVTRRLALACPDGRDGSDAFDHDLPCRMPEVFRALQVGKLPRAVGLTVAAGDGSAGLTLDPERWSASGVRLPEVEGVGAGPQRDVARLEQCRSLFAALDSLFAAFLDARLGGGWADTAVRINNWAGRVPAEVG